MPLKAKIRGEFFSRLLAAPAEASRKVDRGDVRRLVLVVAWEEEKLAGVTLLTARQADFAPQALKTRATVKLARDDG